MNSEAVREVRDGSQIVVGIDGSEANRSAVAYAVDLALLTGQSLRLVAAHTGSQVPSPRDREVLDGLWTVVSTAERRAILANPRLRVSNDLRQGDATDVLLDAAKDHAALVLGKRGLGTFGRIFLGSTSTACAGRAETPVYVIPPGWEQTGHRNQPVVVGVDILLDEEATLAHAFTEAQRRGVPLTAVYALDIEPMIVWDPTAGGLTYRYWETRDEERLQALMSAWRDRYPDVAVTVHTGKGNPAGVLLEQAADAQLLVIGRHRSGPFGFGLGSKARAVLHYADVPVLVVPAA